MTRSNNPTLIAYTQQLKPEHWSWADPDGDPLLDGDAQALGAHLVQRLEDIGCQIEASYAIIHDQDMREVWDSATQSEVLELKPRHIHGIVKFADRKGSASLEQLAAALGVEPQFVEKPKAGRYSFDNMLAYLIHAKYPAKHQYTVEEVATLCGRDYAEIAKERRVAWRKGAAQVKKQMAALDAEDLREQILQGEISHDQIMLTDDLYDVYARNKRSLDEAFAAYADRRATRAAAKLRNDVFRKMTLFIFGAAGSGKTDIAKKIIAQALETARHAGERWSVYHAATGNPLDDYKGEEIILLDDLRGSAMEATEWLLLLDPVNASPARARYQNKPVVAPRLIVMTATIPPEEYFYYVRNKGSVDEALDQFIRRLTAQVRVSHVGGERVYDVSPVGRLDRERLVTVKSEYSQKEFSMPFGPLETVTHSADGAIGSALNLIATTSKDVDFEWGLTRSLAEWERSRQIALEAEVEAAEAEHIERRMQQVMAERIERKKQQVMTR